MGGSKSSTTFYGGSKILTIFQKTLHPSCPGLKKTRPLYKDLKILPLSNSLELRQAKHMWKLINGFLPPCMSSQFNFNKRTVFSISYSRLVSLQRFILFMGPITWNQVPDIIKHKSSLHSFNKFLKTHLHDSL